jgi:hypothetical protein
MATRDDEIKTKAQLLEELDELRRQLAGRDESSDAADAASSQPAFTRPMTRRAAIGTWVAPVILSIPLAAVIRTRTAEAGTVIPTSAPTSPPTSQPTAAPAPTVAPTSFPTLATAEVPVFGPGGLAAAAAALAGVGAAKIWRDRRGGGTADSEQPERSDDDSPDKDDETK